MALASAAPTPAAPHDDELQAQLREICSLLKATLRIQPQALLPPLPLPAAPYAEAAAAPGEVATAKREQAAELKVVAKAAKAKSQARKRHGSKCSLRATGYLYRATPAPSAAHTSFGTY